MTRFAVTAALMASLIAGCSTMEVQVDFDPDEKFSGLRTYGWIPATRKPTGDPRIDDNTILEKRIRRAVEGELNAKGFQKSPESPDFWLAYHVTLDKRQSVTTLNNSYAYGPGWGWDYGYRPYASRVRPETFVYQYEEGTLLLDVVDPDGRDLMWRGSATDEVNFSATPAAKEKQINEAVRRMLASFPPK